MKEGGEVFGVSQMPDNVERQVTEQATDGGQFYYTITSELARGTVDDGEAFDEVVKIRKSENTKPVSE